MEQEISRLNKTLYDVQDMKKDKERRIHSLNEEIRKIE